MFSPPKKKGRRSRIHSFPPPTIIFYQVDDPEVIHFLLQTEIIPLCLRIMETGSDLSKTVAIFIVQKLLLDDTGLAYVCATAERFYQVSSVLAKMVATLEKEPTLRLLKYDFFLCRSITRFRLQFVDKHSSGRNIHSSGMTSQYLFFIYQFQLLPSYISPLPGTSSVVISECQTISAPEKLYGHVFRPLLQRLMAVCFDKSLLRIKERGDGWECC